MNVADRGDRSNGAASGRKLRTFEATPQCLFDERSPSRAAQLLPDVKLVVKLRDPDERAFSRFQHSVRLGLEDRSSAQAIDEEPEEMRMEREKVVADDGYFSTKMARHSYAARGRYAEQLERWFQVFDPEQFLIIASEDFYTETPQVFAEILDFLDLPSWRPREFHNFSYLRAKTATAMPAEDRQRLRDEFFSSNRLYDLVGRDYGWQ